SIRVLRDRVSEFTSLVVAASCLPGAPPKRGSFVGPIQPIAKLRACAIDELHQLASSVLSLRILTGEECIHRNPNQEIRKRLPGGPSVFKRCQSLSRITCDPSEREPQLRIVRSAFNRSTKHAFGFVRTLRRNE